MPPPTGADIVDHWRRRLSWEVVLSTKNKPGRAIKPLRERVERLCSNPETASDGARLRIFYHNVLCVTQLRPEKLAALTEAELRASLNLAVAENVKFPLKVKSALAEHRVATLQRRGMSLGFSPLASLGPTSPSTPGIRAMAQLMCHSRVAWRSTKQSLGVVSWPPC